MSVAYGKGDKAKATKLHSQIVRSIGFCENCGGNSYLQCAHIISRRYSGTRTDIRNAFCLCAGCHRRFTDWPLEFTKFVNASWAGLIYESLRIESNATLKVNWAAQLQILKGIDAQIKSGITLQELRTHW